MELNDTTLNLDKVACPHCGVSGEDNLEHEQRGNDWKIECPNCGEYVTFNEDLEVVDVKGNKLKWELNLDSAVEHFD